MDISLYSTKFLYKLKCNIYELMETDFYTKQDGKSFIEKIDNEIKCRKDK